MLTLTLICLLAALLAVGASSLCSAALKLPGWLWAALVGVASRPKQ